MKNNDSINKYNEILKSILIKYIFIEDINDILYQAMRKYEEISRHTKNSEDMGKFEDIEKLGGKSAKKANTGKKDTSSIFEKEINSYTTNDELKIALVDFCDMRNNIKKPIKTKGAFTRLFNKLDKLSNNDDKIKIDILEKSILNNWQDIWELKEDNVIVYKTSSKDNKKNYTYVNMPTLTGKELEDAIEANNDLDMF